MKKTIFSLMFAIYCGMALCGCSNNTTGTTANSDSTVVDSTVVDTLLVDSVANDTVVLGSVVME